VREIQLKLEDVQVEVLTRAFKTLNRFNWIKMLKATGFVSAEDAVSLEGALQSLADQLEKDDDGENW
jgi:argininosuccinate lyase